MFGYVTVDKMELKVREYYKYKGYYCGLCKTLKKQYHQISRFTLNYDMTYLIVLLSSLYEVDNNEKVERCLVHPVNKQKIITNAITEYAASMNVVLSYYKCLDNWMDEKDLKSYVYAKAIYFPYKKAQKTYPEKTRTIKEKLHQLTQFEKEEEKDLDQVANKFGEIMSELATYRKDHWQKYLKQIGYYLGKYIYILDAYDDLEKDLKTGAYNPLKFINKETLDQYVYDVLTLQLASLEHEIEKLPLTRDKGILDNILYSGIMTQFKRKQNKEEVL